MNEKERLKTLFRSISEDNLRTIIRFLEEIDKILENLRDPDRYVRTRNIELLESLMEGGVLGPKEVRGKTSVDEIIKNLSDRNGYVRARNAEVLKYLMEASVVGSEEVSGQIPVDVILKDIRDQDGLVRARNAEVLKYLIELGIISTEEVREQISLIGILKSLEDPDRYVRARNAEVLKYLIEANVVNREEVRRQIPLKGILKGLEDPDRYVRAWNAETLIYLVEPGVVSQKQIRQIVLDKFKEVLTQGYNKPLDAEFYYYYLRLFELLRDDHNALLRINNYLDHNLLTLSQLIKDKYDKDFFYNELVKMIRENEEVKETHNILAEKLQDFLATRIASLSEGDITIEMTMGMLLAHVIKNKGTIAFDKVKNAFRLLSIQFKDGGNSPTTTAGISKAYLRSLPPLEFKKPPVKPPKFQPVEDMNTILKIDGRSLQSVLGDAQLYKRMGRTLVYEATAGKFIAIKFLKHSRIALPGRHTQDERENPGRLIYESEYFGYLHTLKHKRVPLEGNYPTPLLINGKRAVRISGKDLRGEMKIRLQEFSAESKSNEEVWVDVTDGYYTIMAYTIDTADYFTYLHEADDERIAEASKKNIHDLFVLARYGLIHPDIIDLFHNLIQIHRPEEGRFLWNVDIIRPMVGRAGAGRLHAGKHAVSYPNKRLSGLADFAEMVSLDDLIFLDHHHSQHTKIKLRRFFIQERKKFLLAHFMGNYLLAWVLIEGKRLKEHSHKLNWQRPQELADSIKKIYSTAYKAFTQSNSDDTDISSLIDWHMFARQMAFFMSNAYKNYEKRPIPKKIFGKKNIYIRPGDGWGFIHRDVIKTKLNLDGERLSEILDKYFSVATSERRLIPPFIFIFRPHFKKLIRGEKDDNLRCGLEYLYVNYSKGWRFDGINCQKTDLS